MYNPNITPRCAIRIFTKWIKINKELLRLLTATGYHPRTRTFTPRQVQDVYKRQAYHKGMLRSNDKGTNTFRKITRESYKCLGKKMNDDCIIKAYVYKKAGFNKLSYSYKKPLYN